MDNLLEVQGLTTCFPTRKGPFPAIQNVSFGVPKGKSLGIVGESGSGKSVTALSIMRLTQEGNGWVESGVIKFGGDDILKYNESKMRKVRGNKISMIFQEPMTSLNPVHTIGAQIAEVMVLHRGYSKKVALDKAVEILDLVKIPNPRARIREYPFQLSGGMRQRVMIGMALACEPELLIADEPTTALDVTTQAEILDLLEDLRTKLNMSLLFISHDLGVISRVCDEVIVMYAGEVVERASVMDIFVKPSHPYTQALIECIPKLGFKGELKMIPGNIPSISERPTGCRFRNRCPYAFDKCQTEPPLFALKAGGAARCWLREREAK
jgi:peptide/nickel transport system ATP-binding protein